MEQDNIRIQSSAVALALGLCLRGVCQPYRPKTHYLSPLGRRRQAVLLQAFWVKNEL
jgi:hypothetical protein